MDQVGQRLAALAPADADVAEVAAVADRIRTEFYQRIGLADLLSPHTATA